MSNLQELETKSIKSLLWLYAWPAVVSQIIASVYNIVDRIFLGQYVGPLAIAGLSITMPLMNIAHACGSLVGVGACSRMSIVLGRRDTVWAEKILGNSIILTVFFGSLYLLVSYIFMNPILQMFGASEETIGFARSYMVVVNPGMFFTMLAFNATGLIRASGYPTKSMWILTGGAVLNILLDALFISLLHWGITGAAWATTISMFVSSVFAIWHFVPKKVSKSEQLDDKEENINVHTPAVTVSLANPSASMGSGTNRSVRHTAVTFRKHCWSPKLYIFRNILAIGISPFSMNIAACFVVALLNSQLIRYGGDLAIGANGIVNSVSGIVLLLFIGVCQGMQPIAGYNYGAGKQDRLKEIYLLTMSVCVAVGLVGSLCALIFPRAIASCFTTDEALILNAIPAMRYLLVMAPLIGWTVVNSQFFQSIDKPWIAIVTSLSRQVLFLIPIMFILPHLFVVNGHDGLTGVWVSCTVCDFLGAALSVILFCSQLKIFKPGYQPPQRAPRKEHGPSN